MRSALVHFDPQQKERLTRRARKRGKSFSQEVRDAVDLYLTLPVETEEELRGLSLAARRSAGRSLKQLDSTIAAVARTLKQARNGR
jgi:plasmid stability protein